MPRCFDQARIVAAPTNGQQMLCFSDLDGRDRLYRIQTRDGAVDFALFGVMFEIGAALRPSLSRPGSPERLVDRHLGQCFGDEHLHAPRDTRRPAVYGRDSHPLWAEVPNCEIALSGGAAATTSSFRTSFMVTTATGSLNGRPLCRCCTAHSRFEPCPLPLRR